MSSNACSDIVQAEQGGIESHEDMIAEAGNNLMEVSSGSELPQTVDNLDQSNSVDSIPVIVIEEKNSDHIESESSKSAMVLIADSENEVFDAPTTSDVPAPVMVAIHPDTEKTLHDWSPTKSPSTSILKKSVSETPPSVKSRLTD